LDAQAFGRFTDALIDDLFGRLAKPEAEGHVVVHAHVRIQGIALEDHRNIPVFGRDVVHDAIPDPDFAFGNFLQTGKHTQTGRLSAARRPDQDKELLVRNFDVEVFDRHNIPGITLSNVLKRYACHWSLQHLWAVQRTRPVKNGLQTAQKLLEHYGTLCHLAQLVSAKLTRSHHLV